MVGRLRDAHSAMEAKDGCHGIWSAGRVRERQVCRILVLTHYAWASLDVRPAQQFLQINS
jgi:hypothetical protein